MSIWNRTVKNLESIFPISTKGKKRFVTYALAGAVVGLVGYGIYKMMQSPPMIHLDPHHHHHEQQDDNLNDMNMEDINLTNSIAIMNGCSSNLSQQMISVLVKQGCTVIIADKYITEEDQNKINNIKELIISKFDSNLQENIKHKIIILPLDINNYNSIKTFVQSFNSLNLSLHYLIHNIDYQPSSYTYETNLYGQEKLFAQNYLGCFYLTLLLTPLLIKSSKNTINGSKVINITSFAALNMIPSNFDQWIKRHAQDKKGPTSEEYSLNGWTAYAISKAAILLWAREYNNRYKDQGVISYCIHSGIKPKELDVESKSLSKKESNNVSNLWSYIPIVNKWFGNNETKTITKSEKKDKKDQTTTKSIITTLKLISDNNIEDSIYWCDGVDCENKLRVDLRASSTNDDNKEQQLWQLSEELMRQTGLSM